MSPRGKTPEPAPLLVVGIDGADWNLVQPWIDAGELPALAALQRAGEWGRAVSTVPPATFPAWTSFATASEPAAHGVFDFTRRRGYGVRFVSARDRAMPTIWSRLSDVGRRVCVYNLPAAYPPDPLRDGVFISGFDTPVATAIDPSFVHPPELHRELTRRFGPLVISDLNEVRIGPGWHARALDTLLRDVARRGDIALHLLRRAPWDAFFVLFGESDTAGHHFWWLHDERSPRHRPGPLRDGLMRVYRAIDACLARLIDALPCGATVLVLSDHGMGGAGTRVVSINRFLAEVGLLRFTPGARGGALALARRAALQLLPARWQGRLARGRTAGLASRLESRSRFAGIDWTATRAFSEDLSYFPGVWLNLAGREPLGRVSAAERDAAIAEVIAALESWRDPATGQRIVASARRREEVYGSGALVERAPDVVVDLALEAGYATTVRRSGGSAGPSVWRIPPGEHAGSKATGMNGTHRPHGLYCWSGVGIAAGRAGDVALAALGARVLARFGIAPPVAGDGAAAADPGDAGLYGDRESAVLEQRLRALGYLE